MIFAQRTIAEANAGRPHVPNFFEADGRVSRIGLQKLKVLVGQLANRLWQLPMVEPELRRRKVIQSGVQRPAS